jgi:hypothetical protein
LLAFGSPESELVGGIKTTTGGWAYAHKVGTSGGGGRRCLRVSAAPPVGFTRYTTRDATCTIPQCWAPATGQFWAFYPVSGVDFFFAVFHTILRYSIQHINTEVRSHQDQRQEAKGENSARDKLCPGCWLGSVDAFDDVYYKLPRSFIDVGRSVYDGYTLSLKLQQLLKQTVSQCFVSCGC